MSRLASFRGPSTPTSSPVSVKRPPQSPASPAKATESTYHRKLRTLLLELRTCARTWDDLVLHDGLKAARSLVDTRTELDNTLEALHGQLPRTRIVGPKLAIMDKRIEELDTVLLKLRKAFGRMNSVVSGLESLLFEADKAKGWKWVHDEPLWTTWSLEKFVTSVSTILVPYRRSLDAHIKMVEILRPHTVTFETCREIIQEWAAQQWIEDEGWDTVWEDLCEVEIDRWGQAK